MRAAVAVSLLALLSGTSARTFRVENNCSFTIWPAIFTDLNVARSFPNMTGWELPEHTVAYIDVPDDWKAGRIWGRRNCDFSVDSGPNSCLDGGCNGGLLCDRCTGTGVPPATIAEFNLKGYGNLDYYAVSLVDGFNLPMRIIPQYSTADCHVADCQVDLVPNCPEPLQGPFDSSGSSVGCKSACAANLDGNQEDSPNCCTGSYNTPATCPSSGVQYYSYFKDNCPNAYAYTFDESSGTALWTCDSSGEVPGDYHYEIIFCPRIE